MLSREDVGRADRDVAAFMAMREIVRALRLVNEITSCPRTEKILDNLEQVLDELGVPHTELK